MRTLVFGIGVVGLAVLAGLVAGFAVLSVEVAVLPPFRPEDDETLREFIPVAIAYATWAITTSIVLAVLWRRYRPSADRDP